jgi:hypothetical protein
MRSPNSNNWDTGTTRQQPSHGGISYLEAIVGGVKAVIFDAEEQQLQERQEEIEFHKAMSGVKRGK